MEDRVIVDLFLARDETAITAAAAKYGSRLRGLASRLLGDPAAAEECENDTYYAAWNAIPPDEPYTYLFPFLARIARNRALDVIRRAAREKRAIPAEELTDELAACVPGGESAEEAFDRRALSDALDRFLDGLDREARVAFLRRYWFGEGIADIAGRLEYSESRVKSMLFRTRNKLKEYLEKEKLL